MKYYVAPNGLKITGTLETIPGAASISGINDDGTPEYSGGTEMFWDDQKPVMRNDKIVYLDEDGVEWTFDQLKVATDDGEGSFDQLKVATDDGEGS